MGSLAFGARSWASQGKDCSLLNLRQAAVGKAIRGSFWYRMWRFDVCCRRMLYGTTMTVFWRTVFPLLPLCALLGRVRHAANSAFDWGRHDNPGLPVTLLTFWPRPSPMHRVIFSDCFSDQPFPESFLKSLTGSGRRYLHIPLKAGEGRR